MSDDKNYEITLLGTGTSTGVPTISCDCETCTSTDPKDKRLRCSLLIKSQNSQVIIDTGPDFRQQVLKYNINSIDGIVYTHYHFDHIGGFDDIRGFNFTTKQKMPIYLNRETLNALKHIFYYAFNKKSSQTSGMPKVDVNIIESDTITINDIELQVIPLKHGKMEVLGFRIGDLAYCTDTNYIPPSSLDKLKGLKNLIIDGLRPHKHPTHFNIEEAVECAQQIGAENTFLTHIAHQTKHSKWEKVLPKNIHLAYDGLVLNG